MDSSPSPSRRLVLGTRGSRLALTQSSAVARSLEQAHPGLEVELKTIRTTGDHITDVALSKIGDKGLFVKEIEEALLRGEVDFAVHSMKDMPTQVPEGLGIACVPRRVPPFDCLVSLHHRTFSHLPRGARIASGSLRRRSQLRRARPDLVMEEIRGNLPTRIRRMQERGLDGTVLALAGLVRMGIPELLDASAAMLRGDMEAATVRFRLTPEWGEDVAGMEVWLSPVPPDTCLPAVGQGALCLEAREDAEETRRLLAALDDPESRWAVQAERALMRAVEGGCQVPVGAWMRRDGDGWIIEGMIGSLSGDRCLRSTVEGTADADPEGLGTRLATTLLEQGGREILEQVRAGVSPA